MVIVWKQRTIPRMWCRTGGNFIPKEKNAVIMGQFRILKSSECGRKALYCGSKVIGLQFQGKEFDRYFCTENRNSRIFWMFGT